MQPSIPCSSVAKEPPHHSRMEAWCRLLHHRSSTAAASAERLLQQGVHYIDALNRYRGAGPTLTVLAGGDAEALERVRLAGGHRRNGASLRSGGARQQVKAVNQVLVAGSYAAVAEAMALGSHLNCRCRMWRWH